MISITRFFGGPPAAVLMRLAIASVIVGILLSALGLNPYNLIDSLQRLFWRIWDMGFEAIEWLATYLILGAIIVLPVWLLSRMWKTVGRGKTPSSPGADDIL